jgi:peptidoglycan L-alanyl-D-glutamate endopeptidase CwlK
MLGLGTELVKNPDRANDPEIAAKILALFIKDKEGRIREALLDIDLKLARRLVNGGSFGLDDFKDAFNFGNNLIS